MFLQLQSQRMTIQKIVSGGQTGVDRSGLDVAIKLGIPHGGWCPRGRRSEAGKIPDRYELTETNAADYSVRTEKNVTDSDGTLIFFWQRLTGGTKLTAKLVKKYDRPMLKIDLGEIPNEPAHSICQQFKTWVTENQIQILNIAGPRKSSAPEVVQRTQTVLTCLIEFLNLQNESEA